MSSVQNFQRIIEGIRAIHGKSETIALHAPVFTGKEREYVLDTIESTFVSSVGAYVTRFEDMLRDITGARYAVACVNGTSALQVALHLCGVRTGDLVITQAISFVATANAIAHCGADPVFLDIDAENLGLSPRALQNFLETQCESTPKGCRHKTTGRNVTACVNMHTFGLPCSMDALLDVCTQWGIPVVEDAAEALGSVYHGHHCGTMGRAGILSFNGNKIVTTGGGGAILTDDPELGRLAKHLTTTAKQPHRWEFRHDHIAWNFRMPNLNAALGCAQLEQLDAFVAEKRRIADAYAALFADTDWTFVLEPGQTRSNYWLCAVLTPDRQSRDAFLEATNDSGVMTRPAWEPLNTLPMYTHSLHDNLEQCRRIAATLVNLPSGVRS